MCKCTESANVAPHKCKVSPLTMRQVGDYCYCDGQKCFCSDLKLIYWLLLELQLINKISPNTSAQTQWMKK